MHFCYLISKWFTAKSNHVKKWYCVTGGERRNEKLLEQSGRGFPKWVPVRKNICGIWRLFVISEVSSQSRIEWTCILTTHTSYVVSMADMWDGDITNENININHITSAAQTNRQVCLYMNNSLGTIWFTILSCKNWVSQACILFAILYHPCVLDLSCWSVVDRVPNTIPRLKNAEWQK